MRSQFLRLSLFNQNETETAVAGKKQKYKDSNKKRPYQGLYKEETTTWF